MVSAEGLADLDVRELVRLVLWLHDENQRLRAVTPDAETLSVAVILDAHRLVTTHGNDNR